MAKVRNDGMRCPYCCAGKWLNCFICCECCADGMTVYAGEVEDERGGERGRPYNLRSEQKARISTHACIIYSRK